MKHIKTLKPSEVWQWIVDNVGIDKSVKLGVDNNAENKYGRHELFFVAKDDFRISSSVLQTRKSPDRYFHLERQDYQFWEWWTDGTYKGNFYVLEDSLPENQIVAENATVQSEPTQEIDFSKIKIGDKVWVEAEMADLNWHGYLKLNLTCAGKKVDLLCEKDKIVRHISVSELEKAETKLADMTIAMGLHAWQYDERDDQKILDEYYQARKKVEELKNNQ